MNKFKDLLAEQLKDIYCIEKESVQQFPLLNKAVDNSKLSEIIDAQIITSASNQEKIKKAGNLLEVEVDAEKCDFLKGVVYKSVDYVNNGPLNDSGILSQIERINSYKVAIYNAAVRFAKELDYNELSLELQNLTNFTYNMVDRFNRFNDNQSDERTIQKL